MSGERVNVDTLFGLDLVKITQSRKVDGVLIPELNLLNGHLVHHDGIFGHLQCQFRLVVGEVLALGEF